MQASAARPPTQNGRGSARARGIAVAAALLAGAVAAGGGSASLRAADPAVNLADSNRNMSGDCRGQDANLSGSGNTVTIRGACQTFQIAGDGNRVLVDMAPNGTLRVYGKNNEVTWTSSGEVEITAIGPGNTIRRAR